MISLMQFTMQFRCWWKFAVRLNLYLYTVLISVMTCTLLNVARLLLVFTTECNFKNFTTVSGQSMKD